MFDDFITFVRQWYGTDDAISLHEPRFTGREREYVLDAIDSTFVSSVGAYVDRFEQELAAYLGARRAVAVVNGTSALQVALQLAGVESGDEVLMQPLTFIATANAVVYNGAHPVFLDVERETLGLNPDAVGAFLEKHAEKRKGGVFNRTTGRRIAAVLPMHTFGHPCRMDELVEIGNEYGISVIEDAAEALGSQYKGHHTGTLGTMGVLSFNGNKIMTSGGGGAIVTNDEKLADRAKHLTTTAKIPHRWEFAHDEVGYNFRMPNLNAALACAQLEKVPDFLQEKRSLAAAYKSFFDAVDWADFVEEPAGCNSNYWLNAVVLRDSALRDELLAKTNDAGVLTRPAWRLMHQLDMFRDAFCGPLENAEWLAERIINMPSSVKLGGSTDEK